MQLYVCGFLFSPDKSRVLLIRKRRPTWQAGLLNGVGGKIEPSDPCPLHAMTREFREEASLTITDWQHCLTLTAPTWAGHFFRSFAPLDAAHPLTDELLETHPTSRLPKDTIPNLHWIIPLLLDDDPLTHRTYSIQIHHP
jgi:8-oxo-dGTP diphosphatase